MPSLIEQSCLINLRVPMRKPGNFVNSLSAQMLATIVWAIPNTESCRSHCTCTVYLINEKVHARVQLMPFRLRFGTRGSSKHGGVRKVGWHATGTKGCAKKRRCQAVYSIHSHSLRGEDVRIGNHVMNERGQHPTCGNHCYTNATYETYT